MEILKPFIYKLPKIRVISLQVLNRLWFLLVLLDEVANFKLPEWQITIAGKCNQHAENGWKIARFIFSAIGICNCLYWTKISIYKSRKCRKNTSEVIFATSKTMRIFCFKIILTARSEMKMTFFERFSSISGCFVSQI